MSDSTGSTSGGTSILGLLGVAFIVLKLCHVIDWPWIWVLAPFWVGLVILLAALLVFFIGWGVVRLVKGSRR